MNRPLNPIDDDAILSLTRKGENQIKEPGTALQANQLEVLVLVDGQSTAGELLRRTGKIPPEEMRICLGNLIAQGYVNATKGKDYGTIDPGDFFTSLKGSLTTDAEANADTSADADVKFLQRNGYYVNIAHSPAGFRPRDKRQNLKILVIDDDADICKLLQMFLKLEGFDTQTASSREEILAGLRASPRPDLLLLDVWMPDANGFEVLASIRRHPALKDLPVVMLTSDATRGAVIKGIRGGANGFVTKPFEIHPLVTAIRTVLGLNT